MSGYRMQWRNPAPGPVDAALLRPDRLATLSPTQMARQRILCGREWHDLGELFVIDRIATADTARLELEGCPRYVRLAAGMTAGELFVEGHAGTLAAAGQRGGTMTVRGDVGDLAGATMQGGILRIAGNAGDQLGAPLPGTLSGMQGGEIIVAGNTGKQAGLRQRRGLIAVVGDADDYAGHHLRAGTIVLGGAAPLPGVGMQRGTIVCLAPDVRVPASFRRDGPSWPGFWALLRRRLLALGFPCEDTPSTQGFVSLSGDRLGLGRGEILIAQPDGAMV
ncbi:MAG: formylmethanofuran dehydrogenase subunit C [Pirellulales bacterium]|nr:formylmethanofuran dehydrogenase subunit C [Pirellulales bacterium]